MANWLNNLCGLIMPDTTATRDTAPAPTGPRMILGGPAAPELCMLPTDWEAKSFADWTGSTRTHKRVTQIKADGINAMGIEGRVIGGREGAPLDCALHCQPGLARLEKSMGCPMVFMGEYVADDGFNATLAEHKAGRGAGVFWLYDAVPHGAWVTGKDYLVPIEQRLMALRASVLAADTGLFVGMLDWWMLDGPETLAKAREVWAAGYEGLVSKAPGSIYERRRSNDWLKVKERHRALCDVQDVLYRGESVQAVIVRAPAAAGIKPIRINAATIPVNDVIQIDHVTRRHGTLKANIEFELTVGVTRSIRGATWAGLEGVSA